jgi:protein tyrosine phosphatase (PTP) superfamily phosphohydrolase (DUF442 family)
MRLFARLLSLAALLFLPGVADAAETNAAAHLPASLALPGIQNAFQVSARILSGSQPEGEEAFAALARLGVKTIISVDGSRPDVDTACRHGLRYIHLPFGYDSVPRARLVQLAKAAQSSTNTLFVHCHHGLHRGPTAAALICQATEAWSTNQAVAWMHAAGTSADYDGLYRSVAAFRPPTPEELLAVTNLPAVATTSSLVEAMVLIDEHHSRLKQAQKAGWNQIPGHADVNPAHEALMLWEQLRELGRSAETARRPADYREHLSQAERSAQALRQALVTGASPEVRDEVWARVTGTCVACHRAYRN